MDQEKAEGIVKNVAVNYPEADVLFVTDDEKVFAIAEEAVEHAVVLDSGDPKVCTVIIAENAKANTKKKKSK